MMKKNRFFDTVMIALILMSSFKIMYSDAFTFNITVGDFSQADTPVTDDTGNTDNPDLPEYTYDEFYEYLSTLSVGGVCTNDTADLIPCSSDIYADFSSLEIVINSTGDLVVVSGEAYCYVDGVLWYEYDLYKYDADGVFFDGGFEINTSCNWICLEFYI